MSRPCCRNAPLILQFLLSEITKCYHYRLFVFFFDDDARDWTSTTTRCFFRRRRTLPYRGSGRPSNTIVLWGPTRVLDPNGISIGLAVFASLTSVTDRPTDHATRSVTIGRIYLGLRSIAMRSNNITTTTVGEGISQVKSK